MCIRNACCAVLLSLAITPTHGTETIVMLRHAEKPAQGLGQLTCRGLNRALALSRLLPARFGKPTAIFAPNPGELKEDQGHEYNYVRPLATIEPTAIRAGLPVRALWGFREIEPLQEALLSPAMEDATVFVAWEHHLLNKAARAMLVRLGGDPSAVPDWANDDYDTLYVMTVTNDSGSRTATFRVERQALDALSDACPGD